MVPSRSSLAACPQFGLRVHHDRSVPRDGFSKRFPRDEQKPDSFFAGLDRYLVATVEENERAIAGAFADQGFAAIDLLFGEHTEGLRGRAKRPGPFEHISESSVTFEEPNVGDEKSMMETLVDIDVLGPIVLIGVGLAGFLILLITH